MYGLSNTKRCKLFEEIADNVWADIISHHSVGVDPPETKYTKDIIRDIRLSAKADPNIGVWANPGYDEIQNGSDLDIFVETSHGHFVWYALQAKLLKQDGRYDGLGTLRNGEPQWTKLNRLSANTGCISKYLLYNGVKNYRENEFDDCNRNYTESQYGCSLVDPLAVKLVVAKTKNPRFKDFHPEHASPWRVIVCCKHRTGQGNLFSTAQIVESIRYYDKTSGGNNLFADLLRPGQQVSIDGLPNEEDLLSVEPTNNLGLNAIDRFSQQEGRTPSTRMVIRTTDSILGMM